MSKAVAVVLLAALFVGACSPATAPADPSPTVAPSDSPTPSQSPSEQPSDAPTYVVDWGPDAAPVDLGDGWTVRDCEGDAPLLCVDRDGELVGTLALSSFEPTEDLAAADTPEELTDALRAFAESLEDGVVQDRAAGCGADYVVEHEPVAVVTMSGQPGVRYGFRGIQDEAVTEFVLSYATVADGRLWIVVAEAATDDGCMASEFDLFTPDDLATFLPRLDAVVAGTVLPDAAV